MSKTIVFVFVDNEWMPAGEFSRKEIVSDGNSAYVGAFEYFDSYLLLKNSIPVDPLSLPLRKATFKTELNSGVFGSIRDALPDYWGRLVLSKTMQVHDEFDILTYSRPDRIGNLDFRKNIDEASMESSLPTLEMLKDVMEGVNNIQLEKDVNSSISSLLLSGTTIGGARPKINVNIDGQVWLAKLPSRGDKVSNAKVEYTMLTVARDAGIEIPEVKIIKVNEQDVLLLKRFDRDGRKRSGMMSALSLLAADERDYNIDYIDIAHHLKSFNRMEDVQQLFKRIVLNGMVSNTDDHARNHAFLFDKDGVRLSPLYDVCPSLRKPGLSTIIHHALKIGGDSEASLKNYSKNAEYFGLSKNDANEIFLEMAEQVSAIPKRLVEIGLAYNDIKLLSNSWLFGKDIESIKEDIKALDITTKKRKPA
jgi:serine/threonine-protein kinase HipA